MLFFFFFKQKTAYEMRISDWSSDVCSSDLIEQVQRHHRARVADRGEVVGVVPAVEQGEVGQQRRRQRGVEAERGQAGIELGAQRRVEGVVHPCIVGAHRSEERRVGKEWGGPCRYRW